MIVYFFNFFSERNFLMPEFHHAKINDTKWNLIHRNETDQYLSYDLDFCADRKRRFSAFDRHKNHASLINIGSPHIKYQPKKFALLIRFCKVRRSSNLRSLNKIKKKPSHFPALKMVRLESGCILGSLEPRSNCLSRGFGAKLLHRKRHAKGMSSHDLN